MAVTIPTDLEEQIDLLTIFVESADEVLNSRFVKQAKQSGVFTMMEWTKAGGLEQVREGPDLEAVKALLLTVRMFSQQNDPTSFENINALVAAMPASQKRKNDFASSVTAFIAFLDQAPSIGFSQEGTDTNGSIFKTFVYGSFAHTTLSKRKRLRVWQTKLEFNDLRAYFDRILAEFVRATDALRNISVEVLKEATPPAPPPA